MKVNIEQYVKKQKCGYLMEVLVEDLKKVRNHHRAGESKEALDVFFKDWGFTTILPEDSCEFWRSILYNE